jgi:polar amino acid transport system ATP-binding protein
VVTHEIGFAREAADTVVFLDEGRIVEPARPAADRLLRPEPPTTPGSVRRIHISAR